MKPITLLSSRRSVGILLIASLVMTYNISCSGTTKEGPLLDDRVFTVITQPVGNPDEAALERVLFKTGRFDNDNCHFWGFGDGAYTAKESGDSITFVSTTVSAKEGTMVWTGVVKGTSLNGTMVWSKEGQADMQYTFSSENITMTNLDGKSLEVQFREGDSVTAEVITFSNGQFESPGCYAWGFSPAAYQAYDLGGKTHFQSLYTSEKEGKMIFYGVISGGDVSGTQFWTKEGQEDIYYSMTGKLK